MNMSVSGFDHRVLVSEGGGVMEAQHHTRISLFLVGGHCGELTHLDLKHKGPLILES